MIAPSPQPTESASAAPSKQVASGRLSVLVAMFTNVFARNSTDRDLAFILEGIRGDRYADQVRKLRALLAENPEAYQSEKRNLPAFCVSGTANSRTEPVEHSGLLQIDLDGLDGVPESVREKLKDDPHIAFGFVSPSGRGLKLGLAIDGERHAESFAAAQSYFRENYSLEIDIKVKDRLRLCFVSHDPDLWTRPDAEPLPLPPPGPPCASVEVLTSGAPDLIVTPSGLVSISESARTIFQRIAPSQTVFWRGGALVELVEVGGVASLEIVKPDAFRSRVERFGDVFAWRSDGAGSPVLKPTRMSKDYASAIMATVEARQLLPPVASVTRCPVLLETAPAEATVLGEGYHSDQGGLLILKCDEPPQVPVDEAAKALPWLVDEFGFQSAGDRSRALAAFITPALRMGGLIRGNVPIDCAEADQSQSGKGYRHNLVCALYNESSYFVTARNGGVGSTDESFAAALIAGRPFICLDNFRGHLDSQNLEAFVTAPGLFPARVPHRGEVLVDPKRFNLQMSSNGLQATRDLANRASICRIRKRPGFAYRDTLGELQARQPYFLGCVFSLVAEWIARGKPRTKDTRHDFREWAQTLDWIVRELLEGAPLMDGHEGAQERVSNPALSWLRAVALAVEREGRLGDGLIASQIVELCELYGLSIPGLKDSSDDDSASRQVGRLMRRVFGDTGGCVDADRCQVQRGQREYRKPSGNLDTTPEYKFFVQ